MPLFFENEEFLGSEDARSVRILSEYLGPLSVFSRYKVQDTVVFFGSARIDETSEHQRFYDEARRLAKRLTEWTITLPQSGHRFLVCSGGGPGIMEAANRGAYEAGGRSIGLNIGLPHEQHPNRYITPEFSFEFHYFFMRKLWFAHLAAAAVIFPGGFGTLDELFELMMLVQTGKIDRKIRILLYGEEFWKTTINFDQLVRTGTIEAKDLELFEFVDSPETAFEILKAHLSDLPETPSCHPDFAHSLRPSSTRR